MLLSFWICFNSSCTTTNWWCKSVLWLYPQWNELMESRLDYMNAKTDLPEVSPGVRATGLWNAPQLEKRGWITLVARLPKKSSLSQNTPRFLAPGLIRKQAAKTLLQRGYGYRLWISWDLFLFSRRKFRDIYFCHLWTHWMKSHTICLRLQIGGGLIRWYKVIICCKFLEKPICIY